MIATLKCQLKCLYLSERVKVVPLVCLERNHFELPSCDKEPLVMTSVFLLETMTQELTVARCWRSELRVSLQH